MKDNRWDPDVEVLGCGPPVPVSFLLYFFGGDFDIPEF